MKNKKNWLVIRISLFIAVLALTSFSCGNVPGVTGSVPDNPTPENILTTAPDASSAIINGPEGVSLEVMEGALSDSSGVMMEVLPPSELPWNETPFEPDGPQYRVLLGDEDQLGRIIMTIPLPGSPDPARHFVYAAWVQPDQGSPSLVGVIVRDKQVTFPIVGAGKYQLLKIPSLAEMVKPLSAIEPLNVPSYPQLTPSWCSPTAMTNLAGYHQGSWPTGGLGSVWGESSNWYLAGLAHQPATQGNFFHNLLRAAGYTTPDDVYQSFENGNTTLIVWNWYAFTISDFDLLETPTYLWADILNSNQEYAQELFKAFHAYVEWNVWGGAGYPRPVAWGSNLADHSRTITGSDGSFLFFNDPGSGSWNEKKSWEVYFQETMASLNADVTEIIGTLTLSAEPRPENERRAVLWLYQRDWSGSGGDGSITLRQGPQRDLASWWSWDGTGSRTYGYFFYNESGDLPWDQNLGVQFKSLTPGDAVEYGYSIRSISDAYYDYSVQTELFTETGKVSNNLPDQSANVASGERVDIFPAGSFPIAGLEPGLYHLKFTLFQGTIVQDVKYVFFRMAPPKLVVNPNTVVVVSPSFCREGPGSLYSVVTGFDPGQELLLVGLNPERTWGKFETELGAFKIQCWVSLSLVDITGEMDVPILVPPPIPTTVPTVPPALPTAIPTVPACSLYTTPQTCAQHAECIWDRLSNPNICKSK